MAAGEPLLDAEAGDEGDEQKASTCVFAVVAGIICSPILFGFALAFTSPTMATLTGHAGPELSVMTTAQGSTFASVVNVGCMIGSLVGSPLADRFGRKSTLLYGAIPYALTWYGIAASSDWRVLSVFRFIGGIFVGIGSVVAPVYIGEVATKDLRGTLGAVNQLGITLGIFLVNLTGTFVFAVPGQNVVYCQWRHMSLLAMGVALCLLSLVCMPESPPWLAKKGKKDESVAALLRLRKGNIRAELRTDAFAATPSGESQSMLASAAFFLRKYPKQFTIGIGLQVFQQISGVNAVVAYAGTICAQAGMENANASALTVMGAQIVFTGISCVLMDRAGRRSLLLFGAGCMSAGCLILAYYFNAVNNGQDASSTLALGGLTLFIFGFSLGLGPIPWLIISDMLPTEARTTAMAVGATSNWLCSFAVVRLFPVLEDVLSQQGTFLLFALNCAACFLFTFVRIPETRKKTIEEVVAMLK